MLYKNKKWTLGLAAIILASLGKDSRSARFYDEEGYIDVPDEVPFLASHESIEESTESRRDSNAEDESGRSMLRSLKEEYEEDQMEERRLRELQGRYPHCQGGLKYIGDGYCDPQCNNEYCGYDEGDCCRSTCSQCQGNLQCMDPDVVGFPRPSASDYRQNLKSDQQEWLDLHNACRKKYHNKYGKQYMPLMYSDFLEKEAQRYANELATEYCDDYHHSGSRQGENLACLHEGKHRPDRVMKAWCELEEIDNINGPWQHGSGHWAQVIWHSTRYVGCAHSYRTNKPGKRGGTESCIIYACRFLSAGNCDRSDNNWHFDILRSATNCEPKCPRGEGCFHPIDRFYKVT